MYTTLDIIKRLSADVGWALVVFVGVLVVLVVLPRLWWRRRATRAKAAPLGACRCGYPLVQLSVPRCPECGRVVGFEATAENLGLTDEQLRRVQLAKDRRRMFT